MKIIDEGVLSLEPGRGAYMPVITPLSDGSFIACQHVGSGLGTSDNQIEVLQSKDGRSWHNRGAIACAVADDGWSYRGPRISELDDGRLLMTASRFRSQQPDLFDVQTEALQRPEMLLLWSLDGGQSWSPPQEIPVIPTLPEHQG